jgi:hypothetical protein
MLAAGHESWKETNLITHAILVGPCHSSWLFAQELQHQQPSEKQGGNEVAQKVESTSVLRELVSVGTAGTACKLAYHQR